MKKIILSTLVAITAAAAFAAPSQAGWRYHQNHYYGQDVRIVIDRDYGYRSDDYCTVKKIKKYNKWGERVIKFVTICN